MKYEVIDLSLELFPNISFPKETYSLLSINEIEKDEILNIPVYNIQMTSHTGTFVEIPWQEFPKDFLFREAVVVDLMDIWMKDIITEARFENINFEGGVGVILKTKWHSRWISGEIFKDPPILSQSACNFLVEKRIKFLGTDFPLSKDVHDIFLSKDIFLIHNLYNLVSLKKDKIFLVIAPLNIKGVRIIPARVLAFQSISQ